MSLTAKDVEGIVRCPCGAKYWDQTPSGVQCHSCKEYPSEAFLVAGRETDQ